MNPLRRFSLFLLLLVFALAAPELPAQQTGSGDTLRILRIDTSAFPLIRVHVRVFCAGKQYGGVNAVNVTISDNGVQRQFSMNCPSVTVPMSVAFALDRSGSVAGTTLYRIQEGAWQFTELMQSHAAGQDEAGIVSFNESVTLDQQMTTDMGLLQDAIVQLYAFGNTALWDGVLAALHEVSMFGRNAIKAVVVLSDGGDNSSIAILQDVIDSSRALGIPIYCLCISYHSSAQEIQWMRTVADSTGGMFINLRSPDDIIPAFNAIASLLTGGANDCIIEYKLDCPDGAMHEVTVTAQACGKTLTQKARYRAPLDPGMPSVTLSVDSMTVYENGDLFVPVLISAMGSQAEISELTFKVFRQDSVEFLEALTKNYFARFFSVLAYQVSDTLIVRLTGTATLTGSDTLLVLRYRVHSFACDTTLPYLIFSMEKKTVQCMTFRLRVSDYRILKRPRLQAACTDSVRVRWDPGNADYDPPILVLSTMVSNPGPSTALRTRAWIELPYGMELVSGGDTVFLSPSTLGPGALEQVSFPVRILPVDSARSFRVCITVQSDSGAQSTCCTVFTVERGRPALRISCSMPSEIRWNDSTMAYDPPLFPVTVTVTNVSPVTARSVEAWIHIPTGFSITGSPPTPINTITSPAVLKLSESGSATWLLQPLDRPTADTVIFCIKAAAGLDTAVCCQKVYVTAAPVRARLACSEPRSIVYDEEKQEFTPSVFLVSTTVRNFSGIDMAQARGTISLPPFLSLGAGETVTKNLPGGAVVRPGDSAVVAWVVKGDKPPSGNAQVCIDISASNFPGARCCIPVAIDMRGGVPTLACELAGPDTIRYLDSGYDPNPFLLSLTVRNTGASQAKQVYAALLQGADLSIDPSDRALKLLADSLMAGDSVRATFSILVLDRSAPRLDSVRVSVYAANGGAVVCEKVLYVEAVRGPVLELSCSGPDSLVFADSLNAYLPSPFGVSVTVTNSGTAPADSVVAELLPPANIAFVTGEQAAKLVQPSLLGVGNSGSAAWQVNAVRRDVARIDTLRVQARARGRSPGTTTPCLLPLHIPAARQAQLEVSCAAVSQPVVVGDRYSPDPFLFRVRVKNTGTATAYDVTATVMSQGRLQLGAGDSSGRYQRTMSAGGGETEFTWSFTALPLAAGDTVELCFRVSARFTGESFCCAKLYLPPLGPSGFSVSCDAADTVRFDVALQSYPNPVVIAATVTNSATTVLDSLHATLILPGGLQLAGGETADKLLLAIPPQQTAATQWLVDVVRDTSTVIKERRVRIQCAAGGQLRSCERTIVVLPPPQGSDTAAFTVVCSSPDSILYIDPQIGLQPSPFTAGVEVTNTGNVDLTGIQATLQLPAGISLATGEDATKSLASPLRPGNSGRISWSCVPTLSDITITQTLTVAVGASGAASAQCDARTVVQRVERAVTIAFPRGNVARAGETVSVPVVYTNATQAVVKDIRFDIGFDPATVRPDRVQQESALTAEWPKLQVTRASDTSITVSGAASRALEGSGTLLTVLFQAVSGDGSADPFGIRKSLLTLGNPVFTDGVRVLTVDGDITTSGDCLMPLTASEQYMLAQNRPNPFNPVTTFSYRIPASAGTVDIAIEVYDSYGRLVRRLEQGAREPGLHTVRFDASGLPSGCYHYRLAVPGAVMVRTMILSK